MQTIEKLKEEIISTARQISEFCTTGNLSIPEHIQQFKATLNFQQLAGHYGLQADDPEGLVLKLRVDLLAIIGKIERDLRSKGTSRIF